MPFKDFQIRLAKRKCQHELAGIIELMDGHVAAGVPAKDAIFVRLDQRASIAIRSLQDECTKLKVIAPDYTDIAVGVPKLRELHNLSTNSVPNRGAAGIGIAVFAGVAGLAATVYAAALHNMYVYLTHFSWIHS